MKQILTLIVTILILIACTPNDLELDGRDSGMLPIDILYVSDVDYLNYVVAERFSNGTKDEYCYKIRGNGGVCQELYLGTSPYIPLIDNYYLIDWKWGDFMYEPYNVLLNMNWEQVSNRIETWNINYPIVSIKCNIKWGTVSRAAIDEYLNITPAPYLDSLNIKVSTDHWRPMFVGKYNTINDLPSDFPIEEYMKEVKRQDSLQDVYAKRLRQIIKANALKKVGYFYEIKKQ